MTLKSKDFQTIVGDKSKVAENISVFYFTFVIQFFYAPILYKETNLIIQHLLVVARNSSLFTLYSLCFTLIRYFLLGSFLYSLVVAYYLFLITLRDYESRLSLLVLTINFSFLQNLRSFFSVAKRFKQNYCFKSGFYGSLRSC